ncbi:dTDP-glucose 4,6-dehydratase [Haladaptatus pallidirubidus]|uniref:dTDP-glucose 4,6-dehydratase n=1 Tax=Haladaptatus pallidirubidus TaxID=1008152 RepID=A0AAV3UHS3_9EURY|nr:dTDP-glucose 4,6-dehydratase [Haladaptatus pallidirubidus]
MQILVTGGAGFIGSNFVHYLLTERNDIQITTLDKLTYAGSRSNLSGVLDDPRHTFINGDICDRDLVTDLVADADIVVNFAAESHVDRSIEGAYPFVETNVMGTQTLLEAATETEIQCFLQISTDEVYGEILDGKFSENDNLRPRNPYSATKASADLLAQSYAITHDLPIVITRTCNNFGPRQHREKLIPKFIRRAAAGKSLPVYGDGLNVREWIYVEDNCRALDLVIRDGNIGEIYNIGSGYERTNIEVTQEIINNVNAGEDLVEFVDDRAGHDQRYALDTTKIENLGWESKWSFEEGLEQTVDHYLINK